MKTYNFYDTSSLILRAENLFEDPDENIVISSITLQELENLKTSYSRDLEFKTKVRKLIRLLDENPEAYEVYIYFPEMLEMKSGIPLSEFELNNDIKILATALHYDCNIHPDDTVFYTNDLALKNIANLYFGNDSIKKVEPKEEKIYQGYREVEFDEEAMAEFYQNLNVNAWNLNINEYLVIKNTSGEIVELRCWTGEEFRHLSYDDFNSEYFGKVRPIKGDIQQAMFADSLCHNTLTLVKGPAGTGKSYLSLAFLFSELQQHHIDKIIIFCNTVATKNAAKLGFYPGSREEKLMDSQIGNFLSSKLGSSYAVEQLIQQDKLIILPLSDLRGYDTTGFKAGIYITEAQNLDIGLMKLAIQRIGEDSICVIDGDYLTQLDMDEFAGDNNGMRRLSEVFRNTDIYGEITLQTIHRSKLAMIAEEM